MEGLHLVLGLRGHAPGRAADVYGFATFLLRACVLDDLRHLSLEAVDDGDDLVWVAVDDEADNLLPGDHLKLEGARRGDAPLLDALQREGAEDFAIDLYQLQAAFADVHIELSLEVACARGGGGFRGCDGRREKSRGTRRPSATLAWSTRAGTRLSNPSGAP